MKSHEKVLFVLIVGISILLSTSSFASQSYIGFGLHSGTYYESYAEVDMSGVKIKGGKYIADNIALEAHGIMAWGTYYGVDLPGTAIYEFLKADVPLGDSAELYGLLGFSQLSLEALGYTADDSALSYGFGIEGNVAKDFRIGIEWIYYINETYYDYAGFNISITKLF